MQPVNGSNLIDRVYLCEAYYHVLQDDVMIEPSIERSGNNQHQNEFILLNSSCCKIIKTS